MSAVDTAGAAGTGATTAAAWTADPYTRALRSGRGPLFLRRGDGWLLPLDVERWCEAPDRADWTVLDRCRGTVLDIGCGPGRLVAALAGRGHRALGIDVSPEAVARTTRSGGAALHRSVFEPLPGEGRWDTALLIDGNIGIGGDPAALLGRMAGVCGPAGSLIVECVQGVPGEVDERCEVRVDDGRGGLGTPFPWARVGAGALAGHAAAAGWVPAERWTSGARVFVRLARLVRPGPQGPNRPQVT
ncbi:class I SAM-dependent methyltransferase [Streptomyces sp. G-G2]|uniref:class I SAM-dependent methyltransferase n=1 Tax=Streptomyces sp. G-G2 TaxID=3046201 RepID=UPI0024B9E949|nr:class I SAM-dependent methyltransferase [Streptomyces sp. G-G2]MDJ0382583.1 methyltransferase domain-containing protein [Streptomyces sp. G-G2]